MTNAEKEIKKVFWDYIDFGIAIIHADEDGNNRHVDVLSEEGNEALKQRQQLLDELLKND